MNHTRTPTTAQNQWKDDDIPPPILNFNFDASSAEIEQRLAEALQNTGHISQEPEQHLNESLPISSPHAAPIVAPPVENPVESGLLAELAREMEEKLGSKRSAEQDSQAKAQRLHEALGRIVKFLNPLVKYMNSMEPEINRSYCLDARTVYTHLKWRDASVDYRKQDLSSTALLGHIMFSVNLYAPEPVLVTRPWTQHEILKKELHSLRLRVLDELDLDIKKTKQEWLQVRLAPDFPVQIKFQGNYDEYYIDVLSRNIETFGIAVFRLKPEAVTPGMLDDLGSFLIGRKDRLPTALLRV